MVVLDSSEGTGCALVIPRGQATVVTLKSTHTRGTFTGEGSAFSAWSVCLQIHISVLVAPVFTGSIRQSGVSIQYFNVC